MQELPWTAKDIVLWLSGYDALKKNEDKLNQYCFEHGETIVMDALKNMGLGK